MRYKIGASGITFQRTNTDVSAVLRVVCTGEYPVEIVVADAENEKVSIKPTQHYDFSIRPGKISIGSWGGDTYITCYRKSETTLDTCDINGFVNVPSHIDENLFIDGDLQVAGDTTISGGISAAEGSFDKSLTVNGVDVISAVNNVNGKLYIGAGGGCFKNTTTTIGAIPARSMCITLKFDKDFSVADWDSNTQANIIGDLGYANGFYNGICLRMTTDGRLYLLGGRTVSGNVNLTLRNYFPTFFGGTSNQVIPAGTYALVMTVSMNEESTFSQIFVNSALKDSNTMTTINTANFNAGTGFDVCSQGNFHGTDFTKGCFSGQISRVMAFNFDMSATDAPYTIADYQSAKPIPPALCSTTATQRALVAYADYTIARNASTTLVKDISSNGNDATVTGDVKGDKDLLVSTFVDELKTQIAQQA